MGWLKHSIIDFLAVALVIYASLVDVTWVRGLVLGYTGLMVALKLLALVIGNLLRLAEPKGEAPPAWVPHLVYALCTVVPLATGWWLVGAGWAVVWGLSVLGEQRRLRVA